MSPTPRRSNSTNMRNSNSKGSSSECHSKNVEDALHWLYTGDPNIKDAKYFKKLNAMMPADAHPTFEERAQDLAQTLSWMRERRRGGHSMDLSERSGRSQPMDLSERSSSTHS